MAKVVTRNGIVNAFKPNDMIAWLRSKPESEIVGKSVDAAACPIVNYMNHVFGVAPFPNCHFSVGPEYVSFLRPSDPIYEVQMTSWFVFFAMLIDEYKGRLVDINAGEALICATEATRLVNENLQLKK